MNQKQSISLFIHYLIFTNIAPTLILPVSVLLLSLAHTHTNIQSISHSHMHSVGEFLLPPVQHTDMK